VQCHTDNLLFDEVLIVSSNFINSFCGGFVALLSFSWGW